MQAACGLRAVPCLPAGSLQSAVCNLPASKSPALQAGAPPGVPGHTCACESGPHVDGGDPGVVNRVRVRYIFREWFRIAQNGISTLWLSKGQESSGKFRGEFRISIMIQ